MVWRQIWMNEGIPLPSHISRHFCKYGDKSSQVHFLRPGKRCVLVGVQVLMCGPPGFAGGLQAEQIVWKQLIAILTLELLHYEGMRPKHVCMVLLEFVTFEMKNLWDSWNTFLCRWEKPTHTEKKTTKKESEWREVYVEAHIRHNIQTNIRLESSLWGWYFCVLGIYT